jgi:YYY domain-containing protein
VRDTVLFWGFALLVGILALPPAGFLFARLPGQGLALARPLGLLLLGYPVWLLASVDVIPYREWSPFLGLALLAVLAAAIWTAAGRPLPVHASLRLWLAGETVFTIAFFSWALLRSFAPDVWNTEKPMDMAFVNAVNRSEWFPPHDPWMSGESLNYYYFGHYVVALLIRATGVDPASGFNLGVALFYALTASTLFAVAATLALSRRGTSVTRASLAGFSAVVFALVLGNLAGAFELLGDPRPLAEYDWWSPSRVIDGTANEFPFFSYLLGDLHAHVMATPFALVSAGFALQLALAGPRPATRGRGLALPGCELVLAGLVVGSLYAINSLDFPTALALIVGGAVLWLVQANAGGRPWPTLGWLLLLAVTALALFAPFIVQYAPDTAGVGLVRQHDPFTRFAADVALIYALPLWIVGAALAHRLAVPRRYIAWSAVAVLVVLVALAPQRVAGLFLVGALAAVALHAALDRRLIQPERFFWLLVSLALMLVAIGEFAYIRDAFEGTVSFRFNTVFKAGYQAWFLLAIAAGCGLVWAGGWLRRPVLRAWAVGLGLLLALLAIYPVAGSYARTNGFSSEPTIAGDRWLSASQPGDAAAIGWLRANVSGSPTILEAFGPDFSHEGHARISTFTGLPSVIGWAGHELQWGHHPGSRPEDVRLAYSTLDLGVARRLLARYRVRYVVVGSLERASYPAEGLAKFDRLGRRVYERGGTIVYELPSNADG